LTAGIAMPATLTVTPSVIFDCLGDSGVAQLTWTGASGPVQIRLLTAIGPAMTGFEAASGSATTGSWTTDGMKFLLVNQSGTVEASAIARVSCGGTVRTIDPGLQSGSYFPLQVGNTWVYRNNSRVITGSYVVRSITGTETIAGKTYFVLTQASSIIAKLRGDANGVIWMATNEGEKVYLDPGSNSVQKTSYSGPIGDFSDALNTSAFVDVLDFDSSTFVRGIGLAHLTTQLVAGSSGGFLNGLDLVEVRLPGVHYSVPASTVSLSIETVELDVTGKLVPNCAMPCYFTACGIGGSPDPPGTYRPCAQTRIEALAAAPGSEVRLRLLDSTGAVLFTSSATADANGSSLSYVRLPVYTSPRPNSIDFILLPASQYRLTGQVIDAGQETASTSINLRVR
jgi:hypothetical protein